MKAGRLLLSIGTATFFGYLLLLATSSQAAKAIEAPQDLTFEGTFDDDPAVTVALSLTSDRTGVTRARVLGWSSAYGTIDHFIMIDFAGEVYFAPPRTVTDGAFDVSVPGDVAFGGSLSSMRLEGNLATESDALEGTATICIASPGRPCTPATLY